MAFGTMYREEEAAKPARVGVHQVRILKVFENNVKGWETLDIQIKYVDDNAEVPDLIRFFNTDEKSTAEQRRAFNIRMTSFLRAFKLNPQFDVNGYIQWVGKTGYITVDYDKNGFLEIKRFLKEEEALTF